jgi:hypothetical protein
MTFISGLFTPNSFVLPDSSLALYASYPVEGRFELRSLNVETNARASLGTIEGCPYLWIPVKREVYVWDTDGNARLFAVGYSGELVIKSISSMSKAVGICAPVMIMPKVSFDKNAAHKGRSTITLTEPIEIPLDLNPSDHYGTISVEHAKCAYRFVQNESLFATIFRDALRVGFVTGNTFSFCGMPFDNALAVDCKVVDGYRLIVFVATSEYLTTLELDPESLEFTVHNKTKLDGRLPTAIKFCSLDKFVIAFGIDKKLAFFSRDNQWEYDLVPCATSLEFSPNGRYLIASNFRSAQVFTTVEPS